MDSDTRLTFPVGLPELFSAAYLLANGQAGTATFEVSVRRLPPNRAFLVAAGLDQVLEQLEHFQLSENELELFRQAAPPNCFPEHVFDWLAQLRFRGDADALPEGTVVFAGEPIIRVRAPQPQATILKSALLGIIGYQTGIASKVARLCVAAKGKPIHEMSVGTLPSRDTSFLGSRAAYLGGAATTSNSEAASRLGIPTQPSLPWSLIGSDGDGELKRRLKSLSRGVGVLLDTEEPLRVIDKITRAKVPVHCVVIELQDCDAVSRKLRRRMDRMGMKDALILAQGDFDEDRIEQLVNEDAPLDGFGISGPMARFSDELQCTLHYTMVEEERGGLVRPVSARGQKQAMVPGAKAVYRRRERGLFLSDTVQSVQLNPPSGEQPLMVPVLRQSERTGSPSLAETRALAQSQLQMLEKSVLKLRDFAAYPVRQVVPQQEKSSPEELPVLDLEEIPGDGESSDSPVEVNDFIHKLDDSADFGAVSSALEGLVANRLELPPQQGAADGGKAGVGGEQAAPTTNTSETDPEPGLPVSAEPHTAPSPASASDPADAGAPNLSPPQPPAVSKPEPAPNHPAHDGWQQAPTWTPPESAAAPRPEQPANPPRTPESTSPSAERPGEELVTPLAPSPVAREAAPGTGDAAPPPPRPPEQENGRQTRVPIDDAVARLRKARGAGSTPASGAADTETRKSSLESAAARLKALKDGGAPPPSAASAPNAEQRKTDSPAAPPTETQKDRSNLFAAAARLKRLKANPDAKPETAGSPAPVDDASGEDPTVKREEEPLQQDGGALLSAAERLRALRSQ